MRTGFLMSHLAGCKEESGKAVEALRRMQITMFLWQLETGRSTRILEQMITETAFYVSTRPEGYLWRIISRPAIKRRSPPRIRISVQARQFCCPTPRALSQCFT